MLQRIPSLSQVASRLQGYRRQLHRNTSLTGLLDSSSQAGQWWVIVGNSESRGLVGDAQASSVERMPSTSSTSSTSSSPDRPLHLRQRSAGQSIAHLNRYSTA